MTETPIAYQMKLLASPEEREGRDVPIHVVELARSNGVKLSAHLPEDGFTWMHLDEDAARKLRDEIDAALPADAEVDDGC